MRVCVCVCTSVIKKMIRSKKRVCVGVCVFFFYFINATHVQGPLVKFTVRAFFLRILAVTVDLQCMFFISQGGETYQRHLPFGMIHCLLPSIWPQPVSFCRSLRYQAI